MTTAASTLAKPIVDDLPLAVSAGFVATVVFTLVAYYLGIALAGFPLDIGAALGGMLGDNGMLGALAHYVTGSIVFPLGFLIIGRRIIRGPWWIKGAGWGALLWLMAMVVAAPMMGAGLFMQGAGSAGAPIASLIGHLIYGLVLALILRAA